jgi:hypothetical protein
MARNLGIFFFVIILLGVLFMPVECCAQAVPPRVQTLQMIRPVAPPPEPPLQKDINLLRRAQRQLDREYRTGQPLDVEIERFLGRPAGTAWRGFRPIRKDAPSNQGK